MGFWCPVSVWDMGTHPKVGHVSSSTSSQTTVDMVCDQFWELWLSSLAVEIASAQMNFPSQLHWSGCFVQGPIWYFCNSEYVAVPPSHVPQLTSHTPAYRIRTDMLVWRQSHPSNSCSVVTQPEERKRVLQKTGRCFVCLRRGHISRACTSTSKCPQCHHGLLQVIDSDTLVPPPLFLPISSFQDSLIFGTVSLPLIHSTFLYPQLYHT